MDTMQVLVIVIAVLGAASLVMAVVFLVNLRAQQRTVQQAARRAVEEERSRSPLALPELRPGRTKEPREPRPERPAKQRHPKKPVAPADDSEPDVSLQERDRLLRDRETGLASQEAELASARVDLQRQQLLVDERAAALAAAEAAHQERLETLAGITADQARTELLARVERDSRLQAAQLARELETEAKRTGEARARQIIVGAIQRLAAEQTTESVVASVPLPSDEMKGRIIGREGRNIRAFEQVTGVNVMIDDTPESVLLSCFDPVRREIARLTLTELVEDGRIHPARIEEVYERSQRNIEELCLRAAEDAVLEMGITDLDPGLLQYIGALKYRTSYGQNVLAHLIECGHIAALMAAELGMDVAVCRRAAFLHDIGKALTHEVEGSHAAVGADLARRHGEHPDIVHAIAAHHNEIEPRTAEAVLTQAADAISGSRPGARRESLEIYVKRLQRLEEIARAHAGVDKVFAMQAGREVRVMVAPDRVSDAESHAIAREIAREVQGELTYPGSIKVTVVRESRAVALAR
ncbi:MAG: ribonuclease Y [Propionicimonas sp.]|uniref:ribonuclease Y n=1 Tax=Propionicimonas sp. TaxID=1955623 RepID=UPI002B1F445C|nr:ribonuclease Y [Propionicimonas sp.]MEA4943700.1 ribonuclease Y [Propionicimonas sp.]MEA5052857.1 ribonuclease Y [Propionicimonas sp.]